MGADGILVQLRRQFGEQGRDVELFKIIPVNGNPARLELARQAVTYFLSGGDDPPAGIPRKTLSNISFEDSREDYQSPRRLRRGIGEGLAANLKQMEGMGETEKSICSCIEEA